MGGHHARVDDRNATARSRFRSWPSTLRGTSRPDRAGHRRVRGHRPERRRLGTQHRAVGQTVSIQGHGDSQIEEQPGRLVHGQRFAPPFPRTAQETVQPPGARTVSINNAPPAWETTPFLPPSTRAVVPGGGGAVLLEQVDAALDGVPLPVGHGSNAGARRGSPGRGGGRGGRPAPGRVGTVAAQTREPSPGLSPRCPAATTGDRRPPGTTDGVPARKPGGP